MTTKSNPREIKFLSLDPYNTLDHKKELGKAGEITSSVIEHLLQELSKKFSGKKVFFKILTPDNYSWSMNTPFDDILVAYSFKEDFKIKEAGQLFDYLQDN